MKRLIIILFITISLGACSSYPSLIYTSDQLSPQIYHNNYNNYNFYPYNVYHYKLHYTRPLRPRYKPPTRPTRPVSTYTNYNRRNYNGSQNRRKH